MPDPSEAFSTLDDFLLSLADGVTRAQEELTRSGLHGEPGRQFAYHLPRVDFELKMNVRVVQDASLSGRYRKVQLARLGHKHLLFRPLTTEESSTMDIAAVVRGAFVAAILLGVIESASSLLMPNMPGMETAASPILSISPTPSPTCGGRNGR